MFREYRFNNISSKHYLNPGVDLSEIELKRLHKTLININSATKTKVDNLYLDESLSMEEIKKHFSTCIVTIIENENLPIGFLISPILRSKNKYILHAGLIIMTKNPGADLMSLTGLCNFQMAYEKYGKIFVTNISSTPSIIEVFSTLVSNPWPSPKKNTKVSPKKYKEIIQILKNEYMDKYFPEGSAVKIDPRRFTMTSNSQEMGFTTDYFKLSRATNYLYQSFCKVWIDYSKGEDIIQVGELTLLSYLHQRVLLFILKIKLARVSSFRTKSSSSANESRSSKAA